MIREPALTRGACPPLSRCAAAQRRRRRPPPPPPLLLQWAHAPARRAAPCLLHSNLARAVFGARAQGTRQLPATVPEARRRAARSSACPMCPERLPARKNGLCKAEAGLSREFRDCISLPRGRCQPAHFRAPIVRLCAPATPATPARVSGKREPPRTESRAHYGGRPCRQQGAVCRQQGRSARQLGAWHGGTGPGHGAESGRRPFAPPSQRSPPGTR